ncbi:hypothetical protein QZH41_005723 [Actinostola sp. cb2023]|nr:hypothetical protein QZH41_005723 [Actinostola sp. cb2023]
MDVEVPQVLFGGIIDAEDFALAESPTVFDDEQFNYDLMGPSCPADVYIEYLFSKGLVDSLQDGPILSGEQDEAGELRDYLISSAFNSYYNTTLEFEKANKDNLVLSASGLLDHDDSSDAYSIRSDSSSDSSDSLFGFHLTVLDSSGSASGNASEALQ